MSTHILNSMSEDGSSPQELRCHKCGKLLAKNDVKQSNLEIKCIRCGAFNSIFKYINDQVIITDSEGVILYANNVLQEVTGYSIEEVVGRTPALWGGQMSDVFYKNMWNEIKTQKKPIVVKVTNKRKDGTLYNATLRISPVFDTEGRIQFYVGMENIINSES